MVKYTLVDERCKAAVADWAANKTPKTAMDALSAIKMHHHRFKKGKAGKKSNAQELFCQLKKKYTLSPAAAEALKARNDKKNKKNNPFYAAKNAATAKAERDKRLQAALLANTDEGRGLTTEEAIKKAKKIWPQLVKNIPNGRPLKSLRLVCIGARNASSLRQQQAYPLKDGWECTGAKGCKFDPMLVYHSKNRYSALAMETALIDMMRKAVGLDKMKNTNR